MYFHKFVNDSETHCENWYWNALNLFFYFWAVFFNLWHDYVSLCILHWISISSYYNSCWPQIYIFCMHAVELLMFCITFWLTDWLTVFTEKRQLHRWSLEFQYIAHQIYINHMCCRRTKWISIKWIEISIIYQRYFSFWKYKDHRIEMLSEKNSKWIEYLCNTSTWNSSLGASHSRSAFNARETINFHWT